MELLLVVAVIGVLTLIAIPLFVKAREHSRSAVCVANLRAASGAFITFAADNKIYPPVVGPGVVPPGMETYLANFPWTKPTPIGGSWAWDDTGYKAGVVVNSPTAPIQQIQEIDRTLDDGNLATGQFRVCPNGYAFVIED